VLAAILSFDTRLHGVKSGLLSAPTDQPPFALGMRLHNEGSYYDAHEAWEELWIDETDDEVRLFLQGLIQVTSAFHKVFFQRQPESAGRLLARGLEKLAPYPDEYLGVALGAFRAKARACAAALASGASLGPKDVPELLWAGSRPGGE
jgi:predicted metal-dependent hydrolase